MKLLLPPEEDLGEKTSLGHQWLSSRTEALWFWEFKVLITKRMGNSWQDSQFFRRIKGDKKFNRWVKTVTL